MDETTTDFGFYGRPFQEKIIQALLTDHSWSAQMAEVLKVDYFEKNYLRFLAEKFFNYYSSYKSFPSLTLLVSIIRDELKVGTDVVLKEQIVEFLTRIKTNPDINDLPYVKEKSLDFCRKQKIKEGLLKAVDLTKENKFEEILALIKESLFVGDKVSVGYDFFDEADSRFHEQEDICIPTGLPALDQKSILRGGIAQQQLGVIVAATGVGKSHFLIQMGANAIKLNKNVVHFTFELGWRDVGLRYDSHFCDIPVDEIIARKEEVKQKYESIPHGSLRIIEYPIRACSVITIRNCLERLSLRGFKPDLLIVDYADTMKSTRAYNEPRHEQNLIYEELRSLAQELHLGIWTASQGNKEAARADIVDLDNMSEAYGKARTSDIVLALSRKSTEKATGGGRLYVAKNRRGKDGVLFPVRIDTSKSKIEILSDSPEALGEMYEKQEEETKDKIRKKWLELKKEKELGSRPLTSKANEN